MGLSGIGPPLFPAGFDEALDQVEKLNISKSFPNLSAQFGFELASLIVAQPELRKKALSKFENPNRMLFVAEALEQASSAEIADFHASHFPFGTLVIDGTGGVGGDSLSLAKAHQLVSFEVDLLRSQCLKWNLMALQLEGTVLTGSVLDDLGKGTLADFSSTLSTDYAWFDPSRRANKKRVKRLDEYEPNPFAIRSKFSDSKLVGIKLSPMDRDEELLALGDRVEFISFRGQCLEACCWFGSDLDNLGIASGVWAVQIESGEAIKGNSAQILREEDAAGEVIYEADPALIRAHGLYHFELPNLGNRPGYLTGSQVLATRWLKGFEVLDDDNFDLKRLRKTLQNQSRTVTAIKSKAHSFRPEELWKQVRIEGDQPVTLLFYEVGKRVRVATCRPLL